jgi:mycothiol synthase
MRRLTVVPGDDGTIRDLAERFADDHAEPAALVGLLDAVLTRADAQTVEVEAEPVPTGLAEGLAERGFELTRTTLQLRRALPVEADARGQAEPISVRPFEPGRDDAAWLEVNNRAFAWHPDQSGRTLDHLRALEAEPWFRADGFLVHDADRGGGLDGFCWTKIHDEVDPPLGEIFVIGVDPDAHGRGLGRALVLAGLDWLHGAGLRHAMLYVEADNVPARHLYDSLGFTLHQAHCWWRRPG